MKVTPKSIGEYEHLIEGLRRPHLKRIARVVDLLLDKIDSIDYSASSPTIDENEALGMNLSIQDIRDIYIRLSSKEFEVFKLSAKANLIYQVFYLPNPLTARSKPNNKATNVIDFELFSKEDGRSSNFASFAVSLRNRLNNLQVPEVKMPGNIGPAEPVFDPQNKIIYYGSVRHSFQKTGEDQRLTFFKLLWEKREVRKGVKLKKKGERTPPETIAANMGMVSGAQIYKKPQSSEAREKFENFIKSINSDFRKKGMPITIARKGGILIGVHI